MKDYVEENREHYQLMAEAYDERYKNANRTHLYTVFLQQLNGPEILDVGCGAGRDSHYFLSQNKKVTAIDLTPRFLEMAAQNAPGAKIIEMDMRDLQFPDQSFNGLWSCLSLHHLKKSEHAKTLQEFNRVLKPGGSLFLRFTEGQGEVSKFSKYSNKSRIFTYYSKEELSELVKSCNFEVTKIIIEDDEESGKALNMFAQKIS